MYPISSKQDIRIDSPKSTAARELIVTIIHFASEWAVLSGLPDDAVNRDNDTLNKEAIFQFEKPYMRIYFTGSVSIL